MAKEKILTKGYTLKIISWENDGDNRRTIEYHTEDLEKAKSIKHMCDYLFGACYHETNSNYGIGNSSCESDYEYRLNRYVEDYPELFITEKGEITKYPYDWASDWAWELMRGSEYYDFRVCESCIILYSPEDIYVKLVSD